MSFFSEIERSVKVLFAATQTGFHEHTSAGQDQVGNWLGHLRSSNVPGAATIVRELETLNNAIGRGDAAAMAAAFQHLGELTAESAMGMHTLVEGTGDKLRELSQKLVTAAGNLRHLAQTQGAVAHH